MGWGVMAQKVRALVVDDSAFMRRVIGDILNSDPAVEVVGFAGDGVEALKKVDVLHPDVVTLDVEMPRLNGLGALSRIMMRSPTPVVMLSAYTDRGRRETIEALELGAVDFIAKPSGEISPHLEALKEEILEKVKLAAATRVGRLTEIISRNPPKIAEKEVSMMSKIVVIGASTGGPKAVLEILSKLPPNLPACFLVVQHMPSGFTASFARRLNSKSSLRVMEAEKGAPLRQGVAYVAPGDYHMLVNGQSLDVVKGLRLHGVRPAIDFTMESAALRYRERTIGVLLTGMGIDGAAGMRAIKERGGITLAQDKETSLVFGMPKAAIKLGCIDEVIPLNKMPGRLTRLLEAG
jgi:two-component system chemotaxis response regulator CheB